MPTVFLNQKSEFSLVGVTLTHGENELTDEQFEKLSSEWGYSHAIEHGLIEAPNQESPSPEQETPKKAKK